MTLIEVLAGLALLSTLLVGILSARSQHLRQLARCERQLRAVAAADALLSGWWQDQRQALRPGSGSVPDDGSLRWRLVAVRSPAADELDSQVLRLEILAEAAPEGEQVLTTVELLLPHDKSKHQ